MFAALKTRVNATAFAKLSDAVATINSVDIDVIFDDHYEVADNGFSGFAATAPAIHCLSSEISAVVFDEAVVVNGVNYKVAGIEPDGNGVTTLILKKP